MLCPAVSLRRGRASRTHLEVAPRAHAHNGPDLQASSTPRPSFPLSHSSVHKIGIRTDPGIDSHGCIVRGSRSRGGARSTPTSGQESAGGRATCSIRPELVPATHLAVSASAAGQAAILRCDVVCPQEVANSRSAWQHAQGKHARSGMACGCPHCRVCATPRSWVRRHMRIYPVRRCWCSHRRRPLPIGGHHRDRATSRWESMGRRRGMGWWS